MKLKQSNHKISFWNKSIPIISTCVHIHNLLLYEIQVIPFFKPIKCRVYTTHHKLLLIPDSNRRIDNIYYVIDTVSPAGLEVPPTRAQVR